MIYFVYFGVKIEDKNVIILNFIFCNVENNFMQLNKKFDKILINKKNQRYFKIFLGIKLFKYIFFNV